MGLIPGFLSLAMSSYLFVVGCYNEAGKPGLLTYRFDAGQGKAELLDSAMIDNASYFTLNREGDRVYAVSENSLDDSSVSTVCLDKTTGKLTGAGSVPLTGSPCYIDANRDFVVTANYGGGTVNVVKLNDGIAQAEEVVYHGLTGGPDSTRQNLPHIHCAVFSPDGKRVYATDFSSDRVLYYDVEPEPPYLLPVCNEENDAGFVSVKADTGPRHLVIDNSGRFAYLIGELSGNVTVFAITDNTLEPIQEIEADPVHERASGDIRLSPDGRYLYVSNRRRNDGIAIFSVDADSGKLTYIDYVNTGRHPRNLAVTPDGRFVFVACRDDNAIEIYARDEQTGLLTPSNVKVSVEKPVCVKFVD